jgi:hypothetical protein
LILPPVARILLVLGRTVAFAAAALSVGLISWRGYYDLLRYASSADPTWGEVGIIPFMGALRIVVAVWVAWSVVRLDGRALARTLLVTFGISLFLLYGWYYLLTGMDWAFLYWVVGGDFLYLFAGLMVGDTLLLPAGTRPTSSRT